jgi:hypothetical protein
MSSKGQIQVESKDDMRKPGCRLLTERMLLYMPFPALIFPTSTWRSTPANPLQVISMTKAW